MARRSARPRLLVAVIAACAAAFYCSGTAWAFVGKPLAHVLRARSSRSFFGPSTTSLPTINVPADPALRDDRYGQPLNVAQYLVDLHDAEAAFDFCGGMMFQLVLSDKLRAHLAQVAVGNGKQPVVFDATTHRMSHISGYSQTAHADDISIFHGREVRQVPDAAGGMGFALHLALAEGDPEGWTSQEVQGYDGWAHDSGRTWRMRERLESEGFEAFGKKFGEAAFTLHHRFYLHFGRSRKLWLSAEDGCEGTPTQFGGVSAVDAHAI